MKLVIVGLVLLSIVLTGSASRSVPGWPELNEAPLELTRGWDSYSSPLSYGEVHWGYKDMYYPQLGRSVRSLVVYFELEDAIPDHTYIAGVHLFDPKGSAGKLKQVCNFGSWLKITCGRQDITREGSRAIVLGAFDFGTFRTDKGGDAKAMFYSMLPSGTYYGQFSVRIGPECNPSKGRNSGCPVVYRTGERFGKTLQTLSTDISYL